MDNHKFIKVFLILTTQYLTGIRPISSISVFLTDDAVEQMKRYAIEYKDYIDKNDSATAPLCRVSSLIPSSIEEFVFLEDKDKKTIKINATIKGTEDGKVSFQKVVYSKKTIDIELLFENRKVESDIDNLFEKVCVDCKIAIK